MKSLIKKLLRESLDSNITYEEEHLGSVYGQDNYELGLYVNGEIMGMVQFVIFEAILTVSMIEVRPEYRRKGYGSMMMEYIKKKHPEAQYKPSSVKTDLGLKFNHKEITESLGKTMIGYKVMRYENGILMAGADSRVKLDAKIGSVVKMPGNGIYMSTVKEYVLDYYSGLADSEVLITFEFNTSDIKTGNIEDKEPEISVTKAKIINLEIIE